MARNATISIDGKSSVDQGDGYPQQSMGSKSVRCDLDTIEAWYDLIRPIDPTPEPIQVDEHGVSYRLCSNGHYSPVRAYSKDSGRKDGLDSYCKACRHEQYLKGKVSRGIISLSAKQKLPQR